MLRRQIFICDWEGGRDAKYNERLYQSFQSHRVIDAFYREATCCIWVQVLVTPLLGLKDSSERAVVSIADAKRVMRLDS